MNELLKNEKTEKPRFELVTGGSSRIRCMHANETNLATCPGGRSLKITRECWEQHVEEGTFNFSSSRKYTAIDCGEVPSFEVSGKKSATPAHSSPVDAAASGRLSEWPAQESRSTVHSTHRTEWSTSKRENV